MDLLTGLVILVVAGVVVYLLTPKKKPTIDIKKFPRKYPDEKVLSYLVFMQLNGC